MRRSYQNRASTRPRPLAKRFDVPGTVQEISLGIITRMERLKLAHDVATLETKVANEVRTDWNTRKLQLQSDRDTFYAQIHPKDVQEERLVAKNQVLEWTVQQQMNCSKSTATRKLERIRSLASTPLFLTQLELCLYTVQHFGHCEHLKWRSCVKSMLQDALDELLQVNWPNKESSVRRMVANYVRDVNKYSTSQFIRKLQELCVKIEETVFIRNGGSYENEKRSAMREGMRIHHEQINASRKQPSRFEGSPVTPDSTPHSTQNLEKTRKTTTTLELDATKSTAISDQSANHNQLMTDLRHLKRLGKYGIAVQSQLQSRANRLAMNCAQYGDGIVALELYDWCISRNLKCDLNFFKCLVTACVRGGWVSQAHSLLFEMRRVGVTPTLKLYHIVIAGCEKTKAWRRALLLVRELSRVGIKPCTATYTAVLKACSTAPREDAPIVYDACKYVGVPEAIAYAAAQRAV